MAPQEQREGAANPSLPQTPAAPPKARQPTLRLAVARGLITAGACLIALALGSAIWGGLFGFHPSATIYGSASSGWEGAASMAVFCLVFVGPPVALVGFVVGSVLATRCR